MNYYFFIAFIIILGALGSAGFFLLKDTPNKNKKSRMVWALTVRIGLSIALFLSVLALYAMGIIQPTGLPY